MTLRSGGSGPGPAAGGGHRPLLVVAALTVVGLAAGAAALVPHGGDGGADARDAVPLPAGPPGPADLSEAFRRAGEIGPLTSLLVSRAGERLGERYYRGATASRVVNVKSASKSVLSALVGIAIEQGHIRGTDQPVAELLPQAFAGLEDPRKRRITVGHLLAMEAGLATTSFSNYGPWVESSDWVRWALERPMECDPGACWEYSTGNTHLLSAALTEATGMDTRTYAARELLGPLGIPARPWDRSPRGYYLGGNNMGFRPVELLRIGETYLDGGRWEGRQVVPAGWIERSWTPRSTSSYNGNDYGYGWWGRRVAGHRVWYAWGYGGQYLFAVPDLELAVVATTDLARQRRRWDADRAIFGLLREQIIPEVRRAWGAGRPAAPRR